MKTNNGDGNSLTLIWIFSITFPLMIEIFLGLIVISIYAFATIYPIWKGVSLSLFDIAIFLFFTPAWLYSIHQYFKHGINITKSLAFWPFLIFKFPFKFTLISIEWCFSFLLKFLRFMFEKIIILNDININLTFQKGMAKKLLRIFFKAVAIVVIFVIILAVLFGIYRITLIPYNMIVKEYDKINQQNIQLKKLKEVDERTDKIQRETEVVEYWITKNRATLQKTVKDIFNDISYRRNLIEKFTLKPKVSKLPQEKKELDKLTSDYHILLAFIKPLQANLDRMSNDVSEKTGILQSNNNQLNNDFSQIEKECKNVLDKQGRINCSTTLEKINQAKKKITPLISSMSETKMMINTAKSKIDISPSILDTWQDKFLELDAKFAFQLNPETKINSWLTGAENLINEAKLSVDKINSSELSLANEIKNYPVEYERISNDYSNLNVSFEKIKSLSEKIDNLNIEESLNEVKNNDAFIKKIQIEVNQLNSSLNLFEKNIQDYSHNLEEIISNLKSTKINGYQLYLKLKNNIKGNKYLGNIQKRKSHIDNLLSKFNEIKLSLETIKTDLNKKKAKWFSDSGQLKNSIDILQTKHSKLFQQLEYKLLTPKILAGFIVVIVISCIYFFAKVNNKKKILKRIASLSNNISELLSTICNSDEYMLVRLYAISLIYNGQSTPTSLEISNIKNAILHLQESKSSDDIKIAAALRQLADALDSRLAEQRSIN